MHTHTHTHTLVHIHLYPHTCAGTELAMMSTTDQEEVAKSYASSRSPLIFRYRTTGLDRGCKIQYLSLYPKETEYLYPPLTFVRAEGEVYVKDGCQWLDVTPQMS